MNLLRFLVIALPLFASCRQKEKPGTLFTEMPSSITHIDFRNDIKENADYNILTYEYLYNGAVMADVNGDGLLDIFVCYSGPGSDADRADELYINNGVKDGIPTFTESAKKYGLDAPGTYTTTVAFFDFDHDGDLDMFMVNHADMFFNPFFNTDKLRAKRHPQFGNRLYRNDGGHFRAIR